MRALFPCASVTGAPKVRSMEIINEVEKDPRGIYTGVSVMSALVATHVLVLLFVRLISIEIYGTSIME